MFPESFGMVFGPRPALRARLAGVSGLEPATRDLQDADVECRKIPWWLWPNVLSLDAPLVSVAWLWIFSRHWGPGGMDPGIAMMLAATVWLIYVSDRWHDSRRRDPGVLGTRHHFHRDHGGVLLSLAGVACAASLILFSDRIPHARIWSASAVSGGWWAGATRPGVWVLAGCAGFAALAWFPGRSALWRHSKNLVAACTFANGTALGAYGASAVDVSSPPVVCAVAGFAMLCLMNLNAIDAWESGKNAVSAVPGTTPSLLVPMAALLPVSVLSGITSSDWFFAMAIWIAAAGLWVVDRFRARLSASALRVLADVALVVPLFIAMSLEC